MKARRYWLALFLLLSGLFPLLVSADTALPHTITSDTTLSVSGSPYIVGDFNGLTVPAGVTLTLDPGVIIKFGPTGFLSVNGNLVVNGTAASPVNFTSLYDDSLGGDSTNDGNVTSPTSWNGVLFGYQTGATAQMHHLILQYGSIFNEGDIVMDNSVVEHSSSLQAFYQDFGSALITASEFANNSGYNIRLNGGTFTLKGSNVHDMNAAGIWLKNATVDVENTTFANITTDPISVTYPATFTHSSNTISSSSHNYIAVTGTISSDADWNNDSSIPYTPYNLNIAPGSTLTVDAGTIVKSFQNGSQGTQVAGTLNVLGTAQSPVHFTSINDDSVGGDSFSDGNAIPPAPGDWLPVTVLGSGAVTMTHADVAYGGAQGGAAFSNEGGTINLNAVTFHDNSTGLGNDDGNTVVTNSQFMVPSNHIGASYTGGSLAIHGSSFVSETSSQSSFGISTSFSSPGIVDATNNWWGDASGPSYPTNPGGTGLGVSSKVNFTPWLTSDPFATSTGTTTPPTHNPILIVPGVLGTNIFKGANALWFDLEHTFTDFGDQFMDPLQFGSNLLPIDTSLTLGDVIGKETVNVGINIVLFDYSDSLTKELENQGYILNKDLFLFPYDWRYGVDASNADALGQEIQAIRTQTGSNKVDVVAHSTGGLLVKEYAMNHITDNHIGKAVFVGVPNTGAPDAIKALVQGDEFGDPFLSDVEMQKIAKNLPVVYDLSPSQQYFNQKGSYITVVNQELFDSQSQDLNFGQVQSFLANDHGLNSQAITQANGLHTSAFDNFDLRNAGVNLYNIVGCKTGTVGKFIEIRKQTLLTGVQTGYELEYTPGDGTVPLESATNLPVDGANKYYALQADHSQMMSENGIRQEIVNVLTGSKLDTGSTITQDISKCSLNGKAISIFSPLRIDVTDQNGNHAGQDANGNIFNQIPDAKFDVVGEHKMLYLPTDAGQTYKINVSGTGTGTFTMQDADVANNIVTHTDTFSDIPVTTSLTGTLDLQSTTLTLDSNGDGKMDQILSPDEGSLSLNDLLTALTAQIQSLSVKDKVKQNLLNKVASLEKQIAAKEQRNAKIITAFQAKLSKQASKGKIDVTTLDDMSALLDSVEAQAETFVLDQSTLDTLRAQIQALTLKQTQKDTLLKRVDTLQNNQRVVKSLSNLVTMLTKKNKKGLVSDSDTQQLLDLLSQISGII